MVVRNTKYAILCIVVFGASHGSRAGLGDDNGATAEDFTVRQKFIAEPAGRKKGQLAQKLVHSRSPSTLNTMCCDENNSVALLAAWTRLECQVKAQFVGLERGARVAPTSRELTREFAAFAEGRLRVPLPDKWMRCINSVKFNSQGEAFFPTMLVTADDRAGDDISRAVKGRSALPMVAVEVALENGFISIYGDGKFAGTDGVLVVPKDIRNEFEGENVRAVSGICGEGTAIVVVQSASGPGGYVYCLSTRRPLGGPPHLHWKIEMDSRWDSTTRGVSEWFTELRLSGDKVFLFHSSDCSSGVECIAVSTGKREFSFNTGLD